MNCRLWILLIPIFLCGNIIQKNRIFSQHFEFDYSLAGHQSPVTFLNLRSEDNLLISGGENGEIIVWDLNGQNQKLDKQLNGHSGKITHIDFNYSGDQLLTASYDGTCKIWNIDNGNLLKSIEVPKITPYKDVKGFEPTFAIFDGSGTQFYVGGYNMAVYRINIENGEKDRIFRTRAGGITSGTFTNDFRNLIVGVLGRIYVLDVENRNVVKSFQNSSNEEDFVCELVAVPEKELLASWNFNGNIDFWKINDSSVSYSISATEKLGTSNIAFSEDGKYLLTGNDGSKLSLWDLNQRVVVQVFQKHAQDVKCFAYSDDGTYIVTGGDDKMINIWSKPRESVIITPDIIPDEDVDYEVEEVTPSDVEEIEPVEEDTSVDSQEETIDVEFINREIEVQQSLSLNTEKAGFYFYDNRLIDGDIISVKLNNSWIIKRHLLTKEPKIIQAKLLEGDNFLVIYAHNEGSKPPNTIGITVNGRGIDEKYVLKSNMNTSAALKIIYSSN